MTPSSPTRAVMTATVFGTILQLAMVLAGHWIAFVKNNVFAIGGVAISLLAGVIFARAARMPRGPSALRGALVGGLCALIGIAVSLGLSDVPLIILLIGTASSAVGGAIGGAVAAT